MISQNGADLLQQSQPRPGSILVAALASSVQDESEMPPLDDGAAKAPQITFAEIMESAVEIAAPPPDENVPPPAISPKDEVKAPRPDTVSAPRDATEDTPLKADTDGAALEKPAPDSPDSPEKPAKEWLAPAAPAQQSSTMGRPDPVRPNPAKGAPDENPVVEIRRLEASMTRNVTPHPEPSPPQSGVEAKPEVAVAARKNGMKSTATRAGGPVDTPVAASGEPEMRQERAPADPPAPPRTASEPQRAGPVAPPTPPASPPPAPPVAPPADADIRALPAPSLVIHQDDIIDEADRVRSGLEVSGPHASYRASQAPHHASSLDHGARALATARAISIQIGGATGRMTGDRLELRLDPPELGRVSLSFTFAQDGISAVLAADRAETADLLRRHESMLQQELASAGFNGIELSYEDAQDETEAPPEDTTAPLEETTATGDHNVRSRDVLTGRLDIRL